MGNETERAGNPGSTVVFIPADTIGRGDDELGSNLMINFIYHLGKADPLPDVIVMMNAGVKLVVGGSEVLDELKVLEGKGVKILACGTCLNFFKLEGKHMVGRVSNMAEITDTLLNASRVITV